ncbi:hypothetical protein ABZ723_14620 [Streptomyces sp. NPDC006700]|uniref:hypothetical protein n=1 Tax=Streptomyces sp. NPDC006700 TaxID=3154479 RepID=UPI0033E19F8D
MRPLYVSVRLAAAVAAVTAAAGCMSVGADAGGAVRPSHSAGTKGGRAPGGEDALSDGGAGHAGGGGEGRHGHGGKGKPGETPAASDSPSVQAGVSAAPVDGVVPPKPGEPTPTEAVLVPPQTSAAPEPPPASPPAPPVPSDPPVSEPSPSAHDGTGSQLEQRERPYRPGWRPHRTRG